MITDLIAFRTEFAHPTQLPNRMLPNYRTECDRTTPIYADL
ncbi:hypothetical protein [Moorena sp. SIO3A2]|nr:hypothetical protein [Moorena sp. SIO3A2]